MNELERPAARPVSSDSLLACVALILVFLLFRSGNETVIGFGCAAIFSVFFLLNPDAYRDRRGSFRTVYGLMAFLWLCGAIPTLLNLF